MSDGSDTRLPCYCAEAGRVQFSILGIDIGLTSDTPVFHREFETIFGGDTEPGELNRGIEVNLVTSDAAGRLEIAGDVLEDPAGFFLSFSSPTIPIRRIDTTTDGWDRIALGSEDHETFRFRGSICEFRKVARWPRIISHLLFLRLLRLRPDLIFFHAASVDLGGSGVLLIGPKGSGKTTTSLALSSRGGLLLGDETAAYSPSTRELVPFPRPVAIKPGPRAEAIERQIQRLQPTPDEDGIFRMPVTDLLPSTPTKPVPLRHMIFLSRFGEPAAMSPIQPGREELSSLQPLAASLVNQSATQRVFELIRILNGVVCWTLTAGEPDHTAELIERIVEES